MRQVDIYKQALKELRKAEVVNPGTHYARWSTGELEFAGLCALVQYTARIEMGVSPPGANTSTVRNAKRHLLRDSERILDRSLSFGAFWFTCVCLDEPRARVERIDHLNKLIELYEQKDNKKEPQA